MINPRKALIAPFAGPREPHLRVKQTGKAIRGLKQLLMHPPPATDIQQLASEPVRLFGS